MCRWFSVSTVFLFSMPKRVPMATTIKHHPGVLAILKPHVPLLATYDWISARTLLHCCKAWSPLIVSTYPSSYQMIDLIFQRIKTYCSNLWPRIPNQKWRKWTIRVQAKQDGIMHRLGVHGKLQYYTSLLLDLDGIYPPKPPKIEIRIKVRQWQWTSETLTMDFHMHPITLKARMEIKAFRPFLEQLGSRIQMLDEMIAKQTIKALIRSHLTDVERLK